MAFATHERSLRRRWVIKATIKDTPTVKHKYIRLISIGASPPVPLFICAPRCARPILTEDLTRDMTAEDLVHYMMERPIFKDRLVALKAVYVLYKVSHNTTYHVAANCHVVDRML